MYRIILYLVLIALAAAGAAWVADQGGDVVLNWRGWRAETSLLVLALALGAIIVAAMLAWTILRALWRAPARLKHRRRERRQPEPRIADAGAKIVATGARQLNHRYRHRRPAAGGRGKARPHRAQRHRRQRSRRRGLAGYGGGIAQRFRRGAARIEDAGAGRSRRRASLARQGRCPRCGAGSLPPIRRRSDGDARQACSITSRFNKPAR